MFASVANIAHIRDLSDNSD